MDGLGLDAIVFGSAAAVLEYYSPKDKNGHDFFSEVVLVPIVREDSSFG